MKKLALIAAIAAFAAIATADAQDVGATVASVVKIDPHTDTVYIDWSAVEATSKGRGPAAEMPVLVAVSKVMLAVRRGTWKPMPK